MTTRRSGLGTALALAASMVLAPAPARAGADALSLATLVELGAVEVALDLARFSTERVGAIRITNRGAAPVTGWVPACTTVFTTGDPADSPVRPAESGPFTVRSNGTATLVRLFRVIDGGRRAPAGGVYRLDLDGMSGAPESGCRN